MSEGKLLPQQDRGGSCTMETPGGERRPTSRPRTGGWPAAIIIIGEPAAAIIITTIIIIIGCSLSSCP